MRKHEQKNKLLPFQFFISEFLGSEYLYLKKPSKCTSNEEVEIDSYPFLAKIIYRNIFIILK